MFNSSKLTHVAFALAASLPAAAFAQDRSALLLKVPTEAMGASTGRSQPGVSASSPLGYGPSWGDVFGGVGYQGKTRYGGKEDGSLSVGAGLGNPRSTVGVEVVLTSLSTVRSGFGDRMVGGAKVHRLLPHDIGVGVGIEGVKIAGSDFETQESYYVVASKNLVMSQGGYFSAIMLNLGAGNGRFQSEDDVIAGKNGWNVFASTGVRIAPAFAGILDWTGQDLDVALSIAPFPGINFVVTPGVADVTGHAGRAGGYNGQPRFTLGAGLSWHFTN